MSQKESSSNPAEWQTHSEKTNYQETPAYAETVAYAQRLAAASPLVRYQTFGKSGEGRDLPLLIATEGNTWTPKETAGARKAIVLIQACIHAGEPDGKDAGLALLRDIAITKKRSGLLNNVVMLFIPIYNTDGHERVSPFNRINQNGPVKMGWRTTSTYQNLNRDYMKADTPEARAWLSLWNQWNPHLFIDCHVSDGADFRYNITYQHEHHQGVAPSVLAWEQDVIDGKVAPATEAAGNVVSWYLEFKDNRDLMQGIRDFNGSPRFSTGYTPLRNRPGILIETHMLKDYRSRVIGTYDFLRLTLEEVNRDPQSLLGAIRTAEQETLEAGANYDPKRRFALDFELTDETRPYAFKGVEYHTELSEVSGTERVVYGSKPLDLNVPMYDTFRVKHAVAPPLYYIVPAPWQEVIAVLEAHGLLIQRTNQPLKLEVESYRFLNVKWANGPFEGRLMPSYEVESVREQRTFPPGSILLPLAQASARVAINLLEPQAPDSLVAWGFFNAIFEQKEYAESYVLEDTALKMMKENPRLQGEFRQRLAEDAEFVNSPTKRLKFFYERSPYWDRQMNLYPVGRVIAPINQP